MAQSRENIDMSEKFDQQYRLGEAVVMREVERVVCGCDYGGTSWTNRSEADELGELLGLAPGVHLLEVGAGSGWPALYLTKSSGCQATLSDVSAEGLRVAEARAIDDGMRERCRFVLAPGDDLPFDDGAFDAISHSDVLCCVEDKLEVLKECRRVARPSGRMAFSVIYIDQGLSSAEIEQAVAAGPSLVEAPASYPEMLAEAGWHIDSRREITAEFEATVERICSEYESRREALAQLMGEAEFDQELTKLRAKRRAIGDGLLCRDIYKVTPHAN